MTYPVPTDSDYLSLIEVLNSRAVIPSEFTPLTDSAGKSVFQDDGSGSGLVGEAFVNIYTNEIIIIFAGVGTGHPYLLNGPFTGATLDDMELSAGVPPTQLDDSVRAFYLRVSAAAAFNGISASQSNIFVAGNSLGGYEAQYLANLLQLGGANYGGPGIPNFENSSTRATNFINYIMSGDPIANLSTDSPIAYRGLPATMQHYGQVQMLGSAFFQGLLEGSVRQFENQDVTNPQVFYITTAELGILAKFRHALSTYENAIIPSAANSNTQDDGINYLPQIFLQNEQTPPPKSAFAFIGNNGTTDVIGGTVIAHPGRLRSSVYAGVSRTRRRSPSTARWLALAVLTTERKAA